jgi:metal-responsive CopG/Arc/MetJ family transcriptional regulator
MNNRHNLYLDQQVSDALNALARGAKGNKSRIVNDALRDWLDRRATKEIDDLSSPGSIVCPAKSPALAAISMWSSRAWRCSSATS